MYINYIHPIGSVSLENSKTAMKEQGKIIILHNQNVS